MREADRGTERTSPLFSGKLRVEDKVTGVVYGTELNINPDGKLQEISLDDARGERTLSAQIRVDAAGGDFLPGVVLTTRDHRRVLHSLRQKATSAGEVYFSLGEPPYDLATYKAGKTDFRITIKEPRFPGRDLRAEFLASHIEG